MRIGDAVSIDVGDGGPPIEAKIDYLSPIGASDTQSAVARAIVANDGRSAARPVRQRQGGPVGAGGRGRGEHQRAADARARKTVVFVRAGDAFEAREVELGGRDADWVEVMFGLVDGDV